MRSRHWKFHLAGGLMLLTLAGCQMYYPYGAAGYPGIYTAPPAGMMTPQGIYPPTGVPTQPGTQIDSSQVPLNAGPDQAWRRPTQFIPPQTDLGDAPSYESGQGGAAGSQGSNSVPDVDFLDPPRFDKSGKVKDVSSPFN
jgi:hypothetical protein